MIVYAVIDERSPNHPLGDAIETFVRREDADRFVDEVRGDDTELARHLRIVERELDAGDRTELPCAAGLMAPVLRVRAERPQRSP